MNSSFSSMMWKNQNSINQSFNQSFSGVTSFSARQRSEYILSTKTNFALDPFGAPLPSMVKSLLNQAVDGQKISCRVDPNGWAWIVCGRRLFIWRHSFSNESKRSNIIPCRELWLPTSELDHQAQLVSIVTNTGFASSVPACIAVSPEGQITYWPNISNDSGTITISADIPGQECESLASLWPHALILTTTTSTVLLIKPCYLGSKPSLSCTPLILNKGWFGTIGRRVTSMLFNPIPTSTGNETKRSRVVVPINPDDSTQPGAKTPYVYVLHGSIIQTWQLNSEHQLVQLHPISLEDFLRRNFIETAWRSSSGDHLRRIQICLVDLDVMPNQNIVILAAAYDSADSNPMVYYAIVTLDARVPGGKNERFILVDHRAPYVPVEDDHRTSELFSWRILAVPNFFCMVNPDSIILITDKPEDGIDVIDAASSGGSFLGVGRVSESTVTVFAPKHGIMAIKPGNVGGLLEANYIDNIKVPENLAADVTQYNFEDVISSEDSVNRLKTAFLAFITKRTDDCRDIISTLFPAGASEWNPQDSIDMSTIALCEKLIDDAPPTDQRGAYAVAEPDHMGYKSKQLIFRCLNSKKEVVELYLGFLNNVNILQQLTRVVVKEDTIASASILYNDYEKIGFALAVLHLQSEAQYRELIDSAIKLIVRSRSERNANIRSSHMGPNDQFFKDVSRIHQIIRGLVAIEEEQLSSAMPSDMPDIVGRVNEVILRSVSEMSAIHLADKLPKVKQSLLAPLMESGRNEYEIQPWIVSRQVLPFLLKQHHLIVANGLSVTDDSGIRVKLTKELHELTDLVLDNMRKNIESLRNSDRYIQRLKKFEETRHTLLKEFIDIKDYDGALAMAEKYLDYDILVTASVDRGEYDMLEHYFDKYNDTFPEFTFEWFVKQKKHTELVTQFVHSRVKSRLGKFLEAYPELLWHFQTIVGDIRDTSATLKQMAFSEESDADDRLLYLQLSKLAMLASGVPADDVDSMREYDETNYKEDVDLDKLSNMSINEAEFFQAV